MAKTVATATRFSIRRPAEVIGPSVTAFGVGAASTGTRADLLICDDIVDVISQGDLLPKDTKVKVIGHSGVEAIVEAVTEE